MIALFFALSCVSAQDASLDWADRNLAITSKYWAGGPDYDAMEAVEAYEQILRVYGNSERAELGLAKGCILRGRYDAAANALRKAGGSAQVRRLLRSVDARIQVQRALQAKLQKGISVVAIEPVIGSAHRWGVVTARRDKDADYARFMYSEVELRTVTVSDGDLLEASAPQAVQNPGLDVLGAGIFPIKVGSAPAFAVMVEYNSADSFPNTLSVYRGDRIPRLIARFQSSGFSWCLNHGVKGPLALSVTPTWKVFWTDVYEWRGNRFVFANRRHPENYRPDLKRGEGTGGFGDLEYGGSMKLASLHAILGQWRDAREDLLDARDALRELVRRGEDRLFYGSPSANLREIAWRLRWIARRDYNHALLYRPYDFDLQVPPYKLGNAKDW